MARKLDLVTYETFASPFLSNECTTNSSLPASAHFAATTSDHVTLSINIGLRDLTPLHTDILQIDQRHPSLSTGHWRLGRCSLDDWTSSWVNALKWKTVEARQLWGAGRAAGGDSHVFVAAFESDIGGDFAVFAFRSGGFRGRF
jgi:hypothetical protein